MVLLTLGGEKIYPRVVTTALVLRLAALALVVPTHGALGAAIVWSLGTIATSAILVRLCIRRTGIDPSVMILFRART
ncbi:hypothetical protein [Methylobrevis pamukkalensis]|uniref:Polysaccharide biosynthesis protein C-terminal domain-containing protein n=1 Tax=Methylobrevis pamukkalensis TaxID=1439726 RepID=A0A1E3GMW1_9HYPH|nr:hypothetical protein [Methylobrevis pamukkalensis]ODN65398.1 hypothetical protein A6302_04546 [Methylobrevis pamukkalensis]